MTTPTPQQQPPQPGQHVPHASQPVVSQPPAPTPSTTGLAPDAIVRIVFFCKDCYKLVEAQKIGRKYVYRCPTCHTKNVAFGTEKSIRSFYHVEAAPVPPSKPAQTTATQ